MALPRVVGSTFLRPPLLCKALLHLAAAFSLPLSPSAPAQESLDPGAVARRADSWLKEFASAGDFSGAVLLAQGETILFEQAYGFADPQQRVPNRLDTLFRLASVSKTFTAAAIERLVAAGKLRYSDPLSLYLPGIPNGDSITIEQLLTHRSGVGVLDSEDLFRDCLSRDTLLRRLASSRPLFAPGSDSQYSNEGYFLLAAVVERITRESYRDFLQSAIFSPVQMGDTGIACRDLPKGRGAYGSVATAAAIRIRALSFNEAALDGAGSVYSTARDVYRWLRSVDSDSRFAVAPLEYPYGWGKRRYSRRDLVEQSGQLEGFNSHVAIYPKEHIYAVVLSNIQSGFSERIPRDLEAVVFGVGAPSHPPAVTPIAMGGRALLEYAGTYQSLETPYPQTLGIQNGCLAMHWGQDPFWREMAMTGRDTFFLRAEYAQIQFERSPDGVVHRMTWNWPGGASLSFEKQPTRPAPEPRSPNHR